MWHRLIVFVLIIVWSVTLVMASSQQLHTLTPPLSNPGFDVSGRVFVITGGTQGLGFEIAKQLKEKGAIGDYAESDQIHTVQLFLPNFCFFPHRLGACVSIRRQGSNGRTSFDLHQLQMLLCIS